MNNELNLAMMILNVSRYSSLSLEEQELFSESISWRRLGCLLDTGESKIELEYDFSAFVKVADTNYFVIRDLEPWGTDRGRLLVFSEYHSMYPVFKKVRDFLFPQLTRKVWLSLDNFDWVRFIQRNENRLDWAIKRLFVLKNSELIQKND